MSENSVVIINLKELHKINDAYIVLNLTGVCVDYDDEMQMQFEKRIIVGKIVHKYPVYRDLRNGNNDCLVLEMKKAFPEESLLTEGKVFRFMILGNDLISKLLQVQINSFLGFMNFKMFRTFHSSEPSFSIGNLCGFIWIMPNLNFELSKVRKCKECIEKDSADYFKLGEENCASRSGNCLWESRFCTQKKYTQGTSCNKGYLTSVSKEKKNSNKYIDKVANPKTTSLFLRQSRDIRRIPTKNSAKSETGIDKDSVLVTTNSTGFLNTCLQKEKSSDLRIHRSLNQVHRKKYTNIYNKIAVSSSKQCDNIIKRYDPNYFVNPFDEDCKSRTRVIFNERQECAKSKICECIRKNETASLKTNEPGHSRQCTETALRNCVSNCINKKYDCIILSDNEIVQTEKLSRRNCKLSEKCHSGTNDYSKVPEAKINSVINEPAVEASERVQCWLDNIENLSLPFEHSTPVKNNLNEKGVDFTEIDSNLRNTKTVKDNLVSERTIFENKLITTKTNHKKRKLFYADPNALGSPIKNHSEKTKRIFSDKNCQEFEDNFVDPEVLFETGTQSEKSKENEEKVQEDILQQLLEFCAFKEDFDFDCISESNETKPIDNDIKLFPIVDSNHVGTSSTSQYSTHEENQTENAALQINNCDENSPDLNKIVRTDNCNTIVSAHPATNQELNINSQQTQPSQPYYDAEEYSVLKDSSVGSELKNIFKKLSEQSVSSLEKLFSYEDAEARETAIAKLRKLNQKVQIKAVLVDMFPELNHLHPLAIVKGVCRSGCKKYFAVEELPSYKDVILSKCIYCRNNLHRICPECSKNGDKFLCLLYSFELHLLYGTNVIRVAVYGKSAAGFLGCPLETYLSWAYVSSDIISKFNKMRVSTPPEDWSDVTLLQLSLKTKKHYDGTIMPKLVNTYFGDSLFRKGRFICENEL